MARIAFWQVFQTNPDGSLQVLRKIRIGGFILETGQKIQRGITFSEFGLFDYTGRDLEVENQVENRITIEVITGVY